MPFCRIDKVTVVTCRVSVNTLQACGTPVDNVCQLQDACEKPYAVSTSIFIAKVKVFLEDASDRMEVNIFEPNLYAVFNQYRVLCVNYKDIVGVEHVDNLFDSIE